MLKDKVLLWLHLTALMLFVICFLLPYWCHASHNSIDYGLFYKQLENGEVHLNVCNDGMGQTTCALLKSAKIAGILSFIMGALSIIASLVYKREALKKFYSFLIIILEFIFSIVCICFFSSFLKASLSINDDINWETKVSGDYSYSSGLYLWILAILLISSVGAESIRTLYFNKKEMP